MEIAKLFITYVETFGPYLKICGHEHKDECIAFYKKVEPFLSHVVVPKAIELSQGMFCLAKRNEKFVRVNVLAVINPHEIAVEFIDFGHNSTININNIRIGLFPRWVTTKPTFCSTFILLGIVSDWQPNQIKEISDEIVNKELDMNIKMMISSFTFIKMTYNKQFDLSDYLIFHRNLGVFIDDETLRNNFLHTLNKGITTIENNNNNNNNVAVKVPKSMRDVRKQIGPVRPLHASTMMNPVRQSFHDLIKGVEQENSNIPKTGYSEFPNKNKSNEIEGDLSTSTSLKHSVETFKSNSLKIDSTHEVYCSFVENGPYAFNVQLKNNEKELNKVMADIEKIPLRNLPGKPSLGTPVIARFSEDNNLYRALITGIKQKSCLVAYIDYGNKAVVPFHDIFVIPPQLLEYKILSIKFTLFNIKELEPIDDTLKEKFKDLVLYKNLTLKVTPLEGPPLVQYCELFLNGTNVLSILKTSTIKKFVYADADTLMTNDNVVIRYIESPHKFFIQRENNKKKFEQLMDSLHQYCHRHRVQPKSLPIGYACAVLYDDDWYRAEVTNNNGQEVTVNHVDFGFRRDVLPRKICKISEDFLKLPRQGIHCILKGFENSETVKENITAQFEMLADGENNEREIFKVTVLRSHQNGSYTVNLHNNQVDVMKKLFKLNMPLQKYISLERDGFIETPNQLTVDENKQSDLLNSTAFTNQDSNRQPNLNDSWNSSNSRSSEGRESRSSSRHSTQSSHSQTQQKPSRIVSDRGNYRQKNNEDHRKYDKLSNKEKKVPVRFTNPKYQQYANSVEKLNTPSSLSQSLSSEGFSQSLQQVSTNDLLHDPNLKEEYVPLDSDFPSIKIDLKSREEIIICWWVSPHNFFIHQKSRLIQFEKLMKQIQSFYRNKPTDNIPFKVGSIVIARYRQDNFLYRAKITACNQMLRKYKVQFVDFGNHSTISDKDMWLVEKRFADFACMAHLCSFDNIISNFNTVYIMNKVQKYLPSGSLIICEYLDRVEELNYVNVSVNGVQLKDIMEKDGLITKVDAAVNLDLLVSQQIRAKVSDVESMLCFKIEIEGFPTKLLSSYCDIKFAKTHPDLSDNFKEFYDEKSCVFNIEQVTIDKIVMVKPLVPLWKEDTPLYICHHPIFLNSFKVVVVHISSIYRLFVHETSKIDTIANLLEDMYNYYETNGNIIKKPQVGCICAAKSSDGNWYRGRIDSVDNKLNKCIVYYLDYGNSEAIEFSSSQSAVKKLETNFCISSGAFAIEINLPIESIKTKDKLSNQNSVIEAITNLAEEGELIVKIIEVRTNRLIGNMYANNVSIVNELAGRGLIAGEGLEEVRNIINNDQPNIYEYIETVDLTADEEEINEIVSVGDCEVVNDDQPESESESIREFVKPENIPCDKFSKMEKAYLSYCDNPGRFFLHFASDMDELRKLQENLQIVANSLPPLMQVVKGANCISYHSVDKQWYRAKIIDSELMIVQFIDFGNTDVVSDITEIKEMSVFPNIKPLCFPCSLAAIPKSNIDWPDEANNIFNSSLDKIVLFEFITKTEKKDFVNLFIDEQNVTDSLIETGYALPLELLKSGEICYVSHVNNMEEFYIQRDLDSKGLQLIEEYLGDYEKLPLINDFQKGLICAAIFSDDNNWYRAKLLSQTDRGYEVLFIDYGNKSIVRSEIREISEKIVAVPPLAKKCALFMPEHILEWSETAESKFSDIAALGETVFKVDLVEPSKQFIVNLYVDNNNIMEVLEPLCDYKPQLDETLGSTNLKMSFSESNDNGIKDVRISHINSPWDFYVQLNSDSSNLEYIASTLKELSLPKLDNIEIDMKCAAYNAEDQTIYRGKVLEKINDGYNVLFVDYGSKGLVNDLRILPDDFKNIKLYARHCSLENADIFQTKSNISIDSFKKVIANNSIQDLKVEFIDVEQDPCIVKAFSNDENLSDLLLKMLDTETDEVILQNVLLSHIETPHEFYVQFENCLNDIENITEILVSATLKELTDIEIGTICVALYPIDESYYRAKVLKILENNSYEVYFIDFGNKTITSDIKAVPDDLITFGKGFAAKAALVDIPIGDTVIINEHFNSLIESHFGEMFQMKINETDKESEKDNDDDPVLKVSLFVNDVNINENLEKLVSHKLSAANSNLVESFKKCSIVNVYSIDDFYIQFNENISTIVKINKNLSLAEDFDYVSEPKVGEIYAAEYPNDSTYYRAKLLTAEKESSEYEVLFIDIGEKSTSSKLRKLPNELLTEEDQTKHCTLEESLVTKWESASDSFEEIINSHFGETFQVKILKTSSDPWVVQLFYQDKNIDDIMETDATTKATVEQQSDEQIVSENLIFNVSSGVSSLDSSNLNGDSVEASTKFDERITKELFENFLAIKDGAKLTQQK